MNDQITNELSALNRIMYLLEENSFYHLSLSDSAFADFINRLYVSVDKQQQALQNKVQPKNSRTLVASD
jgi:hypothetical protein